MANQFDFLAKAKPASLYKLLEKLPANEAAVVLTGLPHTLAIQSLAYFPERLQGEFLPLMRKARSMPPQDRDAVAGKIRGILDAAKTAKETQGARGTQGTRTIQPAQPPQAAQASQKAGSAAPAGAAPAPVSKNPNPPNPLAGMGAMGIHAHNPYESAPPAKPPFDAKKAAPPPPTPSPLAGLGSKLMDVLGKAASKASPASSSNSKPLPTQADVKNRSRQSPPPRSAAAEPRPANSGKPVPWMPRAATSSPINGPAVPGANPPVAGDPFTSPLAQAGLLDLIGRAQERFLPKSPARGTARNPSAPAAKGGSSRNQPPHPPARPRPGSKPARPEPREGVASLAETGFNKTPRVIGPQPKRKPAGAAPGIARIPAPDENGGADGESSGARRMDGKAILAAILREAGPDVRGSVQQDDPGLMRELRGRMFHFDDLLASDDDALARVFTAAPADAAALALKFAPPELRRRALRAVSPGRAKALESPPGKSGFDEAEAAQKKVLDVALQLQAAGRILIDPRDPDLAAGR